MSLGCLDLALSVAPALAFPEMSVRRGFLVGVFASGGRSVNGRFRLREDEGGEVSSEGGEDGSAGLVDARVLYVRLRVDDIA